MERLVLWVLGMSAEAAIVTGVVLLLRMVFRRLPKGYSCALWLLVLFRLLCPVTVGSSFSLMPDGAVWQGEAIQENRDNAVHMGGGGEAVSGNPITAGHGGAVQIQAVSIPDGSQAAGGEGGDTHAPGGGQANRFMEGGSVPRVLAGIWKEYGIWVSLVWLAGAVWLAATYLMQYIRWKEKVRGFAKVAMDGVRVAESTRIVEPYVCGILRPTIYLPAGMEETQRDYVLRHERMHIRHGDLWVRFLWQAALVLHWFNPLVWMAVALAQKDMEMFCDESVLRRCSGSARKEYALTILRFSMKKSGLLFPVAFGESNTESRVRHILKGKKTAPVFGGLAVLAIALAAVFLLTDPVPAKEESQTIPETQNDLPAQTQPGDEAETESADGLGAGQNTDTASLEPAQRGEEILALARQWASATVGRDGAALAALVDDPAKMDSYKEPEGAYTYGWSSPWPWNEDYWICYAYDRNEAIIYYYANTSDPRVLPWREVLTLTRRDDAYRVAGWKTDTEPVRSAEAFRERFAYESDQEYGGLYGVGYRFADTPLDMFHETAGENTWAGQLLWQESSGSGLNDAWRQPETAAAYHLYLEGGRAVTVESPWEDRVCLRWEFADGATDVICLSHPSVGAKDGTVQKSDIWVVEDILEEDAYTEELGKAKWYRYYEEHPDRLAADSVGVDEMMASLSEGSDMLVRVAATDDEGSVMYGMVYQGVMKGVLLWTEGRCQYFDWYYTSPRMVLPNLIQRDYDGDGEEELAVILLAYTGTGLSAEQLFMLERRKDGSWEAKENTVFLQQIGDEVAYSYDAGTGMLSFREKNKNRLIGEMDLRSLLGEDGIYEDVSFGDIVSFIPQGDELYLQIAPGIVVQGYATSLYDDWVLGARVVYDRETFSLEEYDFYKLSAS